MKSLYFIIAIMAIGLLSYGFSSSYAQVNCDTENDEIIENGKCVKVTNPSKTTSGLNATTSENDYVFGDTVIIRGSVGSSANSTTTGAVTFIITSPANAIVEIGQITPKSDGAFEKKFKTSGFKWKEDGDHKIQLTYGSIKQAVTFGFTSDGSPPALVCDEGFHPENNDCVKDKPAALVCEPGTHEKDDVCVKDEPVALVCDPGMHEKDGECVADIPPPPPKCETGYELVAGECMLAEPVDPTEQKDLCGPGTEMGPDGKCRIITGGNNGGGDKSNGCLIATAAYGSELAPQVQLLREIRDNTLYSTESGSSFMGSFNQFYYSFSPAIADLERQNPAFKQIVKTAITPMLSSLSIMTLADQGSETEVLAYGISVIALNLGMYIAAPIGAVFTARRFLKSRV